jgi:23S rRNA-/tRNA-specific pseudouridylate synthase
MKPVQTFINNHMPVLATGKGWLVVDKPAGITVHNAPGQDVCSLVSTFIQKESSISTQIEMNPDFSINPVHRLDKEASGILLLAATPEMFRFFSKQFESRQVNKCYVAMLHGVLEIPQGADPWGTWRWALSKTAGRNRAGNCHHTGNSRSDAESI